MGLSDRQKDLINYCLTPRTIDELAGHFNCSYHTARNDVLALVDQGILRKSAYPKNKKYSFQTNYASDGKGGIAHLNFSFRGNSHAPVEVINDVKLNEGAVRAVRVTQLAIAKLLYEYDMGIKPQSEKEEKISPNSSMVRARVKAASEFLRSLADLAEQVHACLAWENKDFVRLFYGIEGYDKDSIIKMMDELTDEAQKWPEFHAELEKKR